MRGAVTAIFLQMRNVLRRFAPHQNSSVHSGQDGRSFESAPTLRNALVERLWSSWAKGLAQIRRRFVLRATPQRQTLPKHFWLFLLLHGRVRTLVCAAAFALILQYITLCIHNRGYMFIHFLGVKITPTLKVLGHFVLKLCHNLHKQIFLWG